MQKVSQEPPIKADVLQISEDQRRRAFELLAQFKALSPEDRTKLHKELETELDPRLLAQIDRDLAMLEAGQINLVERTGHPVSIDELGKKAGWAPDSWQMKLLQALDGAGQFERDGQVMASEIITGLRSPESPQFLTSASMERLTDLISKKSDDPAAGELISELRLHWQQEVAEKADAIGNRDNKVSKQEIQDYFKKNPDAINELALQNIGVMLHQIAQVTGEPDPFRIVSRGTDLAVVRTAYVGSFDQRRLIATAIMQVVTADDLKERGKIERANKFFADQQLPKVLQIDPKLYAKTGYDLGHISAAGDNTTVENEKQSYSTLNMEPETPQLNRFTKRYLEAALRDLTVGTGARAMYMGGPLFLDDQGKPMKLDDPRIKYLVGKDGKREPIPTHVYKTALLQFPGGEYSTVGYIMENSHDLKTDLASVKGYLTNPNRTPTGSGRISLAELAKLVEPDGSFKPFEGFLPDAPWVNELMNDKTSAVPLDHPEALTASSFLWAKDAKPKTYKYETPYDVDAALELIGQRLANYKPTVDAGAELGKLQAAIEKAGNPVSRADVKAIVIAARIDLLGADEVGPARKLVEDALSRAHDKNARGPLQSLLLRIEHRAADLNNAGGTR